MSDRPNILLIMADQLSSGVLPAYGHPVVKTPHLDRLAEAGVVFEDAYCNSPLCAPSRASMLTGRLPSRTGVYDNAAELPAGIPTIAHYLRAAGYQTSLIGKMHFVGPDQHHGFEERLTTDIYPADFGWTPDWENAEQRFDWWYHNMANVVNAGAAEASNQLDFDDEVSFQAVKKIRDLARSKDDRPFFLTVSFTHPHDPYVMRQEYLDRYPPEAVDLPATPHVAFEDMDPHSQRLHGVSAMGDMPVDDTVLRNARRAYYASISYVDDQIGEIVAIMDRCGLLEDTVIVFTADHGDLIGEHGLWYKMSFFEGSVTVPLIVSGPAWFEPSCVAGPVSLVDVLPTLAQLADVDDATLVGPLDGESLLPLLAGGDSERTVIAEYMGEGALAPMLMVRCGSWKYVTSPGDPPQLFDLESDPAELNNVASAPDHAHVVTELDAIVTAHWDVDVVYQQVLHSQRSRRVVRSAHVAGSHHSWDHEPSSDAANQYMRNHLDLNEVDGERRFPRA